MPFTPYLSEIKFMGPGAGDFIEVALDNGADPATVQVVVYNSNGTVRSTNALDASPDNTIAGTDVYSVEAAVHRMGAIALVVDGTVVSFVSFDNTVTPSEGPADGMTSTPLGGTANGESLVSTDMGATYSVDTTPDPGVIPCFLAGTLIDTPFGPRPVESLQPGHLVTTLDGNAQPIIWSANRTVTPRDCRAHGLAPIRIPAGTLGATRPVLVSPAHRLMLSGPLCELLYETPQVLASASTLVGWQGIHVARDVIAPTYHHLMFDRHHLVATCGLISESFHPARLALSGLDAAARRDLFARFPALRYRPDTYGPTARRCLRAHEVAVALHRHAHAA